MKKSFKKLTPFLYFLFLIITIKVKAQESNSKIEVVNKMFVAFSKGNMEDLKKTVAENSEWVYEGPSEIPYTGIYNGKNGVVQFISNIINNVDILDFKVNTIFNHDDFVIVTGFEKQKIKKNGKILEQKWVQIYTVENGVINRMEEYANTAHAKDLFE
ncbi:nuclear transport factor 2 family protein [Elizabethkingia anophelis]|nr:nuclear transport factor 2 family protein [Elizabethkingia anophelis]MCT4063413.1 nuclear transport factor 2 family protein [Elizabethkingia anophelis]MCT4109705.1 nuclear transport factor 2 family protein [Elizabethkingia anophelis]